MPAASALVAPALAAAFVAWGTPPSLQPPLPSDQIPPGTNRRGEMDQGIIRGVIQRHVNEVKWCYEEALGLQPSLAGRVMVQFTIAASGQVIASVLQHSTLGHTGVEQCTVEAVRRWQFPRPVGGGIVIVSYPFVFSPTGGAPLVDGTAGAGLVDVQPFDAKLFVHRSTDAKGIPSNGLVAVTEGGLLLVDTAWTESQTEAVLAWGDRRFRLPWIGAVITHDHTDRDGGLAALERRKIAVAALDLTVAKLTRRGVRGVTTLFTARDGVFKDPRGFEAYYPGPGHASDNIVLHFPGLVYGGCLVKSMPADDLGFTGDADLAGWPAAIRNVRARYADLAIVPGHGPVDLSGEAYQHTLDLLAAVKNR